MGLFEPFDFPSLETLKAKVAQLGLDLPFSSNLEHVQRPVAFGSLTLPNAMAIHPMEGCDAEEDGAPGELSFRRYARFASGGAGLLWCEACSVVSEGRTNPRQLWIHEGNVSSYADLVEQTKRAGRESMGTRHEPALILQLTFSGRYSRPSGAPKPVIAHHSPILDARQALPPDYPLITDEELDRLQDSYVLAAQCAARAGFDGVDIKSCHGYLVSELLASFTRPGSRYGGSFGNRTRFLTETTARIRDVLPKIEVTCRLNVCDHIPHPHGFGMSAREPSRPDPAEPIALVGKLAALGVHGINVSIGNPYFQSHYGRPYDRPIPGGYQPPEHPLKSVERLVANAREIQRAFPRLVVVGTGYSWLRHYLPYLMAGVIEKGWVAVTGVGRTAIAYPDFARDILQKGALDPRKSCLTCSNCVQLMRHGARTGCVSRDAEVYAPIYRECRQHSQ
jgi:2,4-dienoyl-CoA reductase (NADPH2)